MRVRAAKGEKNSDLGSVENIVKKLSTLLAFSTVLAYGARAADLPEAPAVCDWIGFYPGGNIGYANFLRSTRRFEAQRDFWRPERVLGWFDPYHETTHPTPEFHTIDFGINYRF